MNKAAYLVAHLDVSLSPPGIVSAAIYSAPGCLITQVGNDVRYVDITHGFGEDFEDATRQLNKHIRSEPYARYYAWVIPFLEAGRHG